MSLFKERQASAKKVIQLQNEILALKSQLQNLPTSQNCEDCDNLKEEIKNILLEKESRLSKLNEYEQEISSLKASLKKLRSENTRLKNKLSKEQSDV